MLVGVKRQLVAAQKPEEAVAEALALAGTPESEAALTAWVIGPSNNLSHRAIALKRLLRSPKPDYLPVFEAVLLSSEFAGLILQGTAPQGLVNGALKATFVQCSAYCATLGAIRKLHLPQADSIIQQIATDRARSGPSPETLRAFTCEEGAHVVPDVAAALASERLWALSTLGDLELLRTIVDDPSESKLIRDWGRRMLEKRAISLHGARGAGDEPSPSVAAPCTLR